MSQWEVARAVLQNPDLLQRGEPLVQALRTVRISGVLFSSIVVGRQPWSITIPHAEHCILIYFLTHGRCVGGTVEPRRLVDLEQGDVLLLPQPGRCILAQDPHVRPRPLEDLLQRNLADKDTVEDRWKALFSSPFVVGDVSDPQAVTRISVLRMYCDENFPVSLFEGLPDLIHLRGFEPRNRAFVHAILSQVAEQGERGLTAQGAATRLAEAMLVKCLTDYLVDAAEDRPGFSRGLRDPYVSKVIGAIQGDPARPWSLAAMSHAAGLSRSAFAERFRSVMEMTPAQFVTAVRMARAAELLQRGSAAIAQIAHLTGYGSEAAFSRAFRKWSGSPPGALRRSGEGL